MNQPHRDLVNVPMVIQQSRSGPEVLHFSQAPRDVNATGFPTTQGASIYKLRHHPELAEDLPCEVFQEHFIRGNESLGGS